jgi:hypothetical protein
MPQTKLSKDLSDHGMDEEWFWTNLKVLAETAKNEMVRKDLTLSVGAAHGIGMPATLPKQIPADEEPKYKQLSNPMEEK